MLQAVLFDLDNTLLGNAMDRFIPRYFGLLHAYMSQIPRGHEIVEHLWSATSQAIRTEHPQQTNKQVIMTALQSVAQHPPTVLEPLFERFYREEFPQLQHVTECRPISSKLIELCLAAKWQVIIATNPLFPQQAIEERLRWAGIPVTQYPFTLVTTYENMHATKPNVAYYQEILDLIDCAPSDCLMVGDDWGNDIVPCAALGVPTWWVSDNEANCPDPTLYAARGRLHDLYRALEAGWLPDPPGAR